MKMVQPTLRVRLKELQEQNARMESLVKRAETERDAAFQDARRLKAEMDQMAYAVSHDLQEPLRSITSYAQMLARRADKNDHEMIEFLGYISEGADRMTALVRDMVVFARIATPKLESVSLEMVLAGLRMTLQKQIAETGAIITNDPLPEVNGDPIQLNQLFQQLLTNALKFRSHEPPRIHISAEEDDGEVVVSIRDNGPGIEPRFHQQVFVVFKRLHGRDIPGNGIGLAVCGKIVQGHGGRIWLESDGKSGSTFRVSLPR